MQPPDDYRALQEHAGFLERLDLGRLRMRGKDRRSYLHGILTNDIESLTAGSGTYAALLTPQGRMVTDMTVFELGDETLIMLPGSLAPAIRDRLDQYIFSEDAQVENVTEATVQFGIYGPAASAVVSNLPLDPLPTVLPSRDFGVDGYEVLGPRAHRTEIEQQLSARGARRVSDDTANVARVEAGIPRFLVDMTTDTIPLEAGIEDRAISMTKGCYPGQEVIIRVLHRGGGRVARKLVGVRLPAESQVPDAGERIKTSERAIGWITSAVMSPRWSRPIALGYVHRDFAIPGTAIAISDDAGEIAALPF